MKRSTAQIIDWELYFEFDDGVEEEFDGLNENLEQVRKVRFEINLPLLVQNKSVNLLIV